MERLDAYIEDCRRMTVREFADAHPYSFLVVSLDESSDKKEMHGFRTTAVSRTKLEEMSKMGDAVPEEAEHFRIMRIVKSPNNPWRNRISIGRARNNDLVLRDRSISKLHAHFSVGDDGLVQLSDAGSRNGTKVNHDVVKSDTVVLRPGDELKLGRVDALFQDSNGLFGFLHTLMGQG